MADKKQCVQTLVMDEECKNFLTIMAKKEDRSENALIRQLIRQEYARRNPAPQRPAVLPEPTQAAA